MEVINAKELYELISTSKDEIKIIDVRSKPEHQESKIPNSTIVPLQELQQHIHEFKTDKKIILYCRSGGRSMYAQSMLENIGIKTTNLQGGMISWLSHGYPTE